MSISAFVAKCIAGMGVTYEEAVRSGIAFDEAEKADDVGAMTEIMRSKAFQALGMIRAEEFRDTIHSGSDVAKALLFLSIEREITNAKIARMSCAFRALTKRAQPQQCDDGDLSAAVREVWGTTV